MGIVPLGHYSSRFKGVRRAPRIHPSPSRRGQGPPCALSRPRILNFFCNFPEISEFSAPIREPFFSTRGGKFWPLGGSARPGGGGNRQNRKKVKRNHEIGPQSTAWKHERT